MKFLIFTNSGESGKLNNQKWEEQKDPENWITRVVENAEIQENWITVIVEIIQINVIPTEN